MPAKPRCPTAEDALADAVTHAVETIDEPGTLTEARFGQFAAEGQGWHWSLTITREISSAPGRNDKDFLGRRVHFIVSQWKRDVARYRQDFTPEEGK